MNESNDAASAAKGTLRDLFGDDHDSQSSDDRSDNHIDTHQNNDNSILSNDLNKNGNYTKEQTNGNSSTQHEHEHETEYESNQTRKRKAPNTNIENDLINCNNITTNDNWNQNIGIFDNVLTQDECDELIAIHAAHAHAGYIDHLQVTRVSDLVVGQDATNSLPLVLPLLRARYKMWERVEEFYPEASLEIFPEYTAISAWHKGAFLRMHYDSNKDYLLDRHNSALLYLNDSNDIDHLNKNNLHHPSNYHRSGFSGGDLVVEVPSIAQPTIQNKQQSHSNLKRIQPRAGRLVCFPSSSDYVHGVEEITRGTRFALTMWFTKHPSAMEALQSLQQTYWSHPRFQKPPVFDPNESTAISGLSLQQPWETPQQAEALCCRILERAGLSKLPLLDSNPEAATAINEYSISMVQQDLLQLIAFCWWKKGVPLGDLLSSAKVLETISESAQPNREVVDESESNKTPIHWKLMGGQQFRSIFQSWKEDYLPKRLRGLSSAMDRWMKHDGGLITSVRDDEME